MKCPRCQAQNDAAARFCEDCGARLEAICPSCGAAVTPGKKFCRACGAALSTEGAGRLASPESYTPRHLAEKILTSKAALEGERKQVTVLFADLADSTPLAERVGPEAMHDLLNEFFELALGEVHRYEGTVNQFLGDGFMALFGAPIGHEDHARRAVLAALGLQRALRERDATLQGHTIGLRVALNTGHVIVGAIGDNLRMDYTAVGDTTNLAARLQQVAEPGSVLIGETTYRLVRDDVRAESLGPLPVKGKREAVVAYRVLGTAARRSPLAIRAERTLSRFVGRDRDLTVMRELLEVAERGHGQVVGIVGEPGLGKSRLLHEFRLMLADRTVTYLEARCLSYGSTMPYLPVIDIVRDNCGIVDADTPDAIVGKIDRSLAELDMSARDASPYLLRLLGIKEGGESIAALSAEAIKERTFETLRQMTLRGAVRRPLILAIEDLHWVDRTSEQYLGDLVESLSGSSVLLVTTYRPGYRPAWLEKSYATQLALRPLADADNLTLVRAALADASADASLVQTIAGKGEGNPFFIEELGRAVIEREVSDRGVPGTVEDVLIARIDRLPATAKRLLQTAAVLGREVPRRILAEVWDEPESLDAELRTLKRAEFVYTETKADDEAHVFKHVLTQEVAYGSLLASRRQALHAAAGRVFEALYRDRLDEVSDRLAHHWARSGDAAKAVEYLARVGQRADESGAHLEAAAVFTEALEHAERLPDDVRDRRHLEFLLAKSMSLFFLGRREEIVDLFERSAHRVAALGDPAIATTYYGRLAMAHGFLGDRQRARALGRRALDEGRRSANDAAMGEAHVVLGMEDWFSGRLAEALEHCREAVGLLRPTPSAMMLGNALLMIAYICTAIGEFALAMQAADEQEAVADAIGSRRLRTRAAEQRAWIRAARGEGRAAIEAATAALALAPDAFEKAIDTGALGEAHLVAGNTAQAIDVLERAVEQASRIRSRQVQAWFRTLLGEAYLAAGRVDDADTAFRSAFEVSEETDYPFGRGRANRGLALVHGARGRDADARSHIHAALHTFETMGADFEVARTCVDAATLIGRSEVPRARELLARGLELFARMDVPIHIERATRVAKSFP